MDPKDIVDKQKIPEELFFGDFLFISKGVLVNDKNSVSSSRGTKRSAAHWIDCFTLFAMTHFHALIGFCHVLFKRVTTIDRDTSYLLNI